MQGEVKHFGGLDPGIGHIVGIAYPSNSFAFDGATVLEESKYVGQDLAGMEFIGKAVDDRNPGVGGKALDARLLEGADHDDINHAGDDSGGVFNGFGAA